MKINSPLSVVLGVSIFVGLGVAATYFYDQAPRCSKSTDECIQDKIEYQRKYTIEQDGIFEDNIKKAQDAKLKFDNDQSTKINTMKLQQTQGWAAKQKQEGNLQNVAPEMLQNVTESKSLPAAIIPQVQASETISTDTTMQHTNSPNDTENLRYYKVLTAEGSPYASQPIDKYCTDAGLSVMQCDLLVGMAQRESQSGTDYLCKGQSLDSAIRLGQTVYHNPVGLKDPSISYPDSNGCYIRVFASWSDFWQRFPQHMADKYDWKNQGPDVSYMSGCWVKGKDEVTKKCLPQDKDTKAWVTTVNDFVNKINTSL